MSRGKYLSLEEARCMGKLKEFAKQHPSRADGRFWPLLKAVAKGVLEGAETSGQETSASYSGTRTRPDTSEDGDR